MEIDVREFAARKKISERRVLQLIEQGDLKARRLSSQWLIDAEGLSRRPHASRPMSPRMSKAFLELLSEGKIHDPLDPAEKSRLNSRIKKVRSDRDPALLLNSWLRRRSEKQSFKINPKDLPHLAKDLDVIPSGLSDPRCGISSQNFFEGYALKKDLPRLRKKYLLVSSEQPNVILRVIDYKLPRPAPIGYVIADLAEHEGAREQAQAARLIMEK